ncbi:hypothetical protein SAMN05216179_0589 [Gracilibacillus kekensis]|uniref:Uncharacterized protein n=1 Tax=Gracilibacillus kekensis TaxID=1027249 RepID=A0A1M7K606_9BACI|nr:hypothetical protein SAMN05216179_0589 [Gracilibacillus kekensis]
MVMVNSAQKGTPYRFEGLRYEIGTIDSYFNVQQLY